VSEDELRSVLHAASASGDVVELALALRQHGERGRTTLTARLLRQEFGLTIAEALAVAAWADGAGGGEESRAGLRAQVRTPLSPG
jgi:hypothetical protein